MRSVKFLVAAGAASLLSSVAFAADMPSILPAPPMAYAPAPIQDSGGSSWFSDVATLPAFDGRTSSFFAEGASKTNLAWALHAGVAYKVTNNFTVELAYRYLDMGTGVHGNGHFFDGTNTGPSSFQFRDMVSQ